MIAKMPRVSRLKQIPRPYRILALGTLVFSLGRGLYAASSIVFFTQWLGLSAAEVGLAVSAAGVMGFLAAIPFGRLADRFGARNAAVGTQMSQACLVAALALVHDFASLLVVVALLGATDRGNQVVRQTLVGGISGEGEGVRLQAYLRTAFNVGVSLGAAAAAPAIASPARASFVLVVLTVAACYALVAAITAGLPKPQGQRPSRPTAPTRRLSAGFILLGLVSGVLALHVSILEVGLPLWILRGTTAPRSCLPVLILVNTVLALAFQVTVSRWSHTVAGAARTLTFSAVATALAALVFALTHYLFGPWLIATLVLATVVLTVGELCQSAGGWGLSFGLSPAQGQGRHLGAFSVGAAMQDAFGPSIVAMLVVDLQPGGWILLSTGLLAVGSLVIPLTKRARWVQTASEGSDRRVLATN
ncbi:MFS transporter [Streptomyces sp. NPDC002676]